MNITSPQSKQDFDKYFQLRWELLRKPWGEPQGTEQDDDEDDSYHVMVTEADEVIGVARLQDTTPGQAQLRYMAVADAHQGKGIGRMIMQHIENHARGNGITEIFLHARENALAFYQALGYRQVEKSYLLFNCIQHYKMVKKL
jgi:N-acetylglutamate synthase-like GNAT family acetyltransferase